MTEGTTEHNHSDDDHNNQRRKSKHKHSHGHHHHKPDKMGRNLLKATLLNFLITVVQIFGGLFANSVSLLSDALHNFSDAVAILISYLTNKASKKKPDEENTFGQKRLEIIAALFNGFILAVICAFLMYEAYERFMKPQTVNTKLVIIIASIGLIVNLVAVLILKKDSQKNLNVKSAYLHLLGDTLSSVAVVAGGIIMYYTELYRIDTLITFFISIYIMKETFDVMKDAFLIISQATPRGIDIEKVKTRVEQLPEIDNLHHIHVWNLNDSDIHFESHIDLRNDVRLSETERINALVKTILQKDFGIKHTTIQFEFNCCTDKSMVGEK